MLSKFKYLSVLSLPGFVFLALYSDGVLVWAPVIYVFLFIPLVELFFKPDEKNLEEAEENIAAKDAIFDYLLYAMVPVHFGLLILFIQEVSHTRVFTSDLAGKILGMGLMCGVFGINIAHELGHRTKKYEQFLAKLLLSSSLYMHFFIEHNKGHHKNVSTPEDPASARKNEIVYSFWFRSVVYGYLSAWNIQLELLNRKGQSFLSFRNEMLMYHIIQLGMIAAVYVFFGPMAVLCFIGAALVGILLLETVNYIEHYGLQRQVVKPGRYEVVQPHHSWNSDHILGRILLFELSRHSDHHYKANRKYQILRHIDESPQMPTGYPGMILLALVPPLWFTVMNHRVDFFQGIFQTKSAAA